MAENKDKSSKSDEQKLKELEQQLSNKASTKAATSDSASAAVKTSAISEPEKATSQAKPQQKKPVASVTAPSTMPPVGAKQEPQKAKTKLLWLVSLINFCLLICVFVAAYWFWLQWSEQQQTQSQAQGDQSQVLSEQKQVINQQKQEFAQVLARAQGDNSQLAAQIENTQQNLANFAQQIQLNAQLGEFNKRNLAELSGRRPADWLLAEADYLVRIAGRKLWLEHDVTTAMLMLQTADSRLQELEDPSLLPLRQELASDIQALLQVNPVSLSSVALSLGGLIPQVDGLPLAYFKKPEPEQQQEEGVSSSLNDWQSNLSKNWKSVTQDFFSVKRKQAEIKPFMSEQQQWLAREQLKFALLHAQTAILREDSALFEQNLSYALTLLAEFFEPEHAQVQQFTESLNTLASTNIERVYPKQFSAAPMLKDLLEGRVNTVLGNGNSQP